ncbi:hypothetical protein PIB19_01290 [Sphingomonas sp. 7/4-4]|uniref:hypothetical protein n=1 Tax=Sphingomonas sp. 7/4-4 TaxID=3018446 RepID=UPI0022F3EB09|nr:hypothetical protein [Sphingomonas sp. 7/4-4]WBY08220.1 hypothetical protein PIB19_01290 [Sphingomonas sp. 7/4-4]
MFKGVFVAGEYAYFESDTGRIFDIETEDKTLSKILGQYIPLTFGGPLVCARLVLVGDTAKPADATGRPTLNVTKILGHQKVNCPK